MPSAKSRKTTKSKPPADPYLAVAWEQHGNVCYLYARFADKRPVMLFDIQEQRVYCYPYQPFAADLSEKSQRSLAVQYQAACRDGEMVLFIRDNVARKLQSYSLPVQPPRAPRPAKGAPAPANAPGRGRRRDAERSRGTIDPPTSLRSSQRKRPARKRSVGLP